MGFSLFNNIAVAAKYALCNYSINRVLIIDFDVHHGNGTQDAFYADSNVLYFSAHQCPLYPGTGGINEIGARGGEGFTVNAPLLAGWGDREYEAVFEDILAPLAMRFKPELILVSAGFDAHWADNIAQMKLSVSGFARLIEIIKVLSDTLCPGKLAFTLEGGYHLQALSTSILASLNILLGNKEFEDPLGRCEIEIKPVDLDSFIKMIQNKHQIKQ
jgi:acetoin utilization deacetylase AcuC-like enzyme